MQRREAKIGLRDGKRHRRPKERKNTAENPKETACLEAASGFAVSWFELAAPHAVLSNRVSATP